jgi:hypothetical protein
LDVPWRKWDSYDVLTPGGIKIEVKSCSYVQSWAQSRPSTIRLLTLQRWERVGSAIDWPVTEFRRDR